MHQSITYLLTGIGGASISSVGVMSVAIQRNQDRAKQVEEIEKLKEEKEDILNKPKPDQVLKILNSYSDKKYPTNWKRSLTSTDCKELEIEVTEHHKNTRYLCTIANT